MTHPTSHAPALALAFYLVGCATSPSAPRAGNDNVPHAPTSAAESSAAPASEPTNTHDEPTTLSKKKATTASAAGSAPASNESIPAPADESQTSNALSDPDLQVDLLSSQVAFDEALTPEHLSCKAAIPLRDAICAIAQRLCSSSPSLSRDKDCTVAQKSCTAAKQQYLQKCTS